MRERIACALVMASWLGCEAPAWRETVEPEPPADAKPAPGREKVPREVLEAVARGEERKLMIVLDAELLEREASALTSNTTNDLASSSVRKAALFALAKQDLLARIAPSQLQLERDFRHLPVIAVRTSSIEALATVLADAKVARVHEERKLARLAEPNLDLIQQPAAVAVGAEGVGSSIAFIDSSNVDYTLPVFGACTAPGVPSGCRVAVSMDFIGLEPEEDPHDVYATDFAAIAASVAPGAQILSFDVCADIFCFESDIVAAFDWVMANRAAYHIAAINFGFTVGRVEGPCYEGAWEAAIGMARAAGVLTVAGAGDEGFLDATGWPACTPWTISVGAVWAEDLDRVHFAEFSVDLYPRRDQVAAFSNSPPSLTMLAPGGQVVSANKTWNSTAAAASHVAGAIALLRAAFPAEATEQTLMRLTSTGRPIMDWRNYRVTPRLDLAAATSGCYFRLSPDQTSLGQDSQTIAAGLATAPSCLWSIHSDADWITFPNPTSGSGSWSIAVSVAENTGAFRTGKITVSGEGLEASATISQGLDPNPPTGTVAINAGAAVTRSPGVSLEISAEDPSGLHQMCVTNGDSCTAYEPFVPTKYWVLGGASGTQTVTVLLRDKRGNTSTLATAASDSIFVDTASPVDGAVTVTGGDSRLTLDFSGFGDALSGLDRYRVVFVQGAAPPATCLSPSVPIYEAGAPQFVHTGLTNGIEYSYRVCAIDAAGNVSSGTPVRAFPAPEYAPPVGTVTVNEGALYTRFIQVLLTIGATDASGVPWMSVSNSATAASTAWVPFAASATHELLKGGPGPRTVYLRFKDGYGSESATPVTASLMFDPIPPMNGQVTAVASDSTVALGWTGFSDALSGVEKHRVVYAHSANAPPSCEGRPMVYEGSAAGFVDSGLQNGYPVSYRVCAIDRAGNVSTGVALTRVPAPEFNPPVGTVVINGGAPYTNSTEVTLTLSASDPSGISQVCLSSVTGCTAWQNYAPSKPFTLPAIVGVRKVFAWYRDGYHNTSTVPVSDTIVYDPNPPVMGTFSATPGTNKVTLRWTNSADSVSGIARYRLVAQAGTTPPAPACASGTELVSAKVNSFLHSVPGGTTTSYRLCAIDGAGNTSPGVTKTVTPL